MMIVSRTAALAAAHQIPDVTSRAIEGPGSAGAMCCGEVRCVSSHERSILTSTANTGVNGGTSERATVRGEHHGMLPFTLTISEYTSRQFASAGLHIAPLEPEAA